MAALKVFSAKAFPKLRNASLDSVTGGKLYYLIRERNAWHLTRVFHYFEDESMHTDMASAKAAAEKQRGPGSVFTIRQWPAVILRSDEGFAAVTEINQISPLLGFMRKRLRQCEVQEPTMSKWPLEHVVGDHATLGRVVDSLLASDNWRSPPRLKNGVTILGYKGNIRLEELKNTRLKQWKSASIGANFYLNWNEQRASVGQTSVLRIVDRLSKL